MKILNKKNGFIILFTGLWLLTILFVRCKDGSDTPTSDKLVFNRPVLVKCTGDTSQSYYLYTPVKYNPKIKWPVIFIYDPHGSGLLCIEKFKEASERYGYILAGSNNSRNGVSSIDHIIDVLTNEVLAKYPVDRQRIYAAGFSGGGRVALTQAAFLGNVKGIMIAGAGAGNINFSTLKQKFDIFTSVGLGDFNYDEVRSLPQQLQGLDWRYNIMEFEGTHAWPPTDVINDAVLWFTMNAMRDNIIPVNKPMIKKIMTESLIGIDSDITSGHYLLAEQKIYNAIAFLKGLKPVKKFEQRLDEIRKNNGYKEQLELRTNSFNLENNLKQGYIDCFASKDTSWWSEQIKMINVRVSTDGELYSRQMYMRLKGFLGIVAYSFTNDFMKRNQIDQAERLICIYRTLEPSNPDALFFKAILYDRRNRSAEANSYMLKARELGFSDWKKFNEMASRKLKNKFNQ